MQHHRSKPELPDFEAMAIRAMNRRICFTTALIVAGTLVYASIQPYERFLPTVNELLIPFAVAATAVGLLRLQRPWAPHLTFWDMAAVLLFLSTAAVLAFELPALQAYFEAIGALEEPNGLAESPLAVETTGAAEAPAAALSKTPATPGAKTP